jgi:hypothetical protein
MDFELSDALLSLMTAVVILIAAIIRQVLVPLIKTKTTREQRQLAYGIVEVAVGSAEKRGRVDGLDGKRKRERAERWIERRFDQLGIAYDEDEVRGWIEDAVYHLDDALTTIIDTREFAPSELVVAFDDDDDRKQST